MATVADVITAARDRHPSFDVRRNPNGPLIRLLDREHRALVSKAVRVNKRLFETAATIPLPLADHDAGYELPANIYVGDGKATTSDDVEVPLKQINLSMRHSMAPWPCFYMDGFTTLRLMGTADEWQEFTELEVRYVPAPAALDAMTDVLVVADEAVPVLVSRLAAYMAMRDSATAMLMMTLSADAEMQQAEYLFSLAQRRVGQVDHVQEG